MIVFNSNLETDYLALLPLIGIPAFVDGISGYTLELVDDETLTKQTFTSGDNGIMEVVADFLVFELKNSVDPITGIKKLQDEKYYTMRLIKDSNGRTYYRDKLFVTKQVYGQKYNNNKDEYVPANTGGNEYIVL